jgi:heavy metal translocating P-type ATPase
MDFKERLYNMLIRRGVTRYLLPASIRNLLSIWRGLSYVYRGFKSLLKGQVHVDVLDGAAIGVSLLQGNFDTAGSIMFLLRLSSLLEDYTRQKAKSALAGSLAINIDTLWIEQNGREVSIPTSSLSIGDMVIVRAGSMIAIDGTVRSGEAGVNQASMTGEPLPVLKKPGDSVFAGTALEDGWLAIEARTLPDGSRMGKLLEMIDHSEALKAEIQARSEHLADHIVPYSFLLSAAVYVFTGNVQKAVSVLLVDYSCAIKLSTPIAVISAMREAASLRIMIKGGKFLEAMAEADTIVFDKTGTLTVANPKINKVIPFEGYTREEVLRTAACLEEHFPHSVARAVVLKAQEEGLLHEEEHAEVEYIVAHGIATTYLERRVIIGSHHFVVEDEGVVFSIEQQDLVELETGGDSVIYLAIDNKPAGFLCINDPPREESKEVITTLKNLGIQNVVMLTGDSSATAKVVAEHLGIDSYRSQVLPEDKVIVLKELKARGHKVIMVGDGVNDSPALAVADVSVAMKDAADIARETADITLLDSDLWGLVTARRLSTLLLQRIKSNFRFIITFNSSLLVMGLSGVITPGTSALLHNVSTMGISAASMRLLLKS